MVIVMNNKITLMDAEGNKYKAEILFTHFDYFYSKNYIIYLIDDDLLASSYEKVDNKFIINNDLTTGEYDMLDKEIEQRLGGAYA